MTRSFESVDGAAFGRGAVLARSGFGAVPADEGADPFSAPAPAPSFAAGLGSLILLLENIASCLDIRHRVHGIAVDPHFIVKMCAGHPASGSHISYVVSARDPLPYLYPDSRRMCIAGFNTKRMFDLDEFSISGLPSGMGHDTISGGV